MFNIYSIVKNYTITAMFWTLLIFSGTVLSNCDANNTDDNPCTRPDTSNVYCTVEAKDFAKMPYHMHDSIRLQYDTTKVFTFILNAIDTSNEKNTLEPQGAPCYVKVENLQHIKYTFTCGEYPSPIILEVYQFLCGSSEFVIFFDLHSPYQASSSHISSPYEFPSLSVNGRTYTNVVKFLQPDNQLQYALYNTTEGILQMISEGKTWQLARK